MITNAQANNGQLDQLGSVISQINETLGLSSLDLTRKPSAGTWQPIAATSGTDLACANGTTLLGRIYVPLPCLVTGIQYLVGSVGGTDKSIVTLYDEDGSLLRASAAAGVTVGTAAQAQQIPFTLGADAVTAATTIALNAGYYWIGITNNGTTAKVRAVPAYCNVGTNLLAGSVAQTFGTITTSVTVPSTFTADKAVVASLY